MAKVIAALASNMRTIKTMVKMQQNPEQQQQILPLEGVDWRRQSTNFHRALSHTDGSYINDSSSSSSSSSVDMVSILL